MNYCGPLIFVNPAQGINQFLLASHKHTRKAESFALRESERHSLEWNFDLANPCKSLVNVTRRNHQQSIVKETDSSEVRHRGSLPSNHFS